MPSVFLRLSGCNRRGRCQGCDTPYALDLKSGQKMGVDEVLNLIKPDLEKCYRLVVTGGEPLWQPHREDLITLVESLPVCDVEIETNGDFEPLETKAKALLLYTVSPKISPSMGETRVNKDVLRTFVRELADFKFVVDSEDDVHKVLQLCEEVGIPLFRVFLMPFARTKKEYSTNITRVFQWCKQYGLRLSPRLQIEAFGRRRGI